MYHHAATAIFLVHLTFIGFVVCGGLAVLRWPKLAWAHLPAAIWGIAVEAGGLTCPLTIWEDTLLRLAGQQGYETSFVNRYLLSIIYPEGLTRELQFALAGAVLLINTAVYSIVVRRIRRARRTLSR